MNKAEKYAEMFRELHLCVLRVFDSQPGSRRFIESLEESLAPLADTLNMKQLESLRKFLEDFTGAVRTKQQIEKERAALPNVVLESQVYRYRLETTWKDINGVCGRVSHSETMIYTDKEQAEGTYRHHAQSDQVLSVELWEERCLKHN